MHTNSNKDLIYRSDLNRYMKKKLNIQQQQQQKI